MTRRGTSERLEDIQAAAVDALEFCKGLDDAGFPALPVADRRTYRALKNVLAEIGEAVKALPPDFWRGTRASTGAVGPDCATSSRINTSAWNHLAFVLPSSMNYLRCWMP